LLLLYSFMEAPLKRVERVPSEVQILPPYLSTKLDRNADVHPRTTNNSDGRGASLEGTGGTAWNVQKQARPYFSFGPSTIACLPFETVIGSINLK
jgi:hypothetical protein